MHIFGPGPIEDKVRHLAFSNLAKSVDKFANHHAHFTRAWSRKMKTLFSWLVALIVFFTVIIPVSSFSASNQRHALVIGNSAYRSAPLRNPTNDATDIASALERLGFNVINIENAGQQRMEDAIYEFGKKLKAGGVGLFYFAGHGMQVKGRNYLVPIGSKIREERHIKYEAVDAGRVLDAMHDAGNNLNIVILDACRDNPFKRSFRSSSRGLARMDAPTGTLIAFATAPGKTASDGEGRNGIFTGYLLKNINIPGLPLEKVLKKVRKAVIKETGSRQVPWESSSLTGDFYFIPKELPVKESPSLKQQQLAAVSQENLFWDSIKDSEDPAFFKAYLQRYPKGAFAILARLKLAKLKEKTEKDEKKIETASIPPQKKLTGRLFVNTEPETARVRILNIKPKFYQGMELDGGRYHLEISAGGYKTQTMWVSHKVGEDKNLIIRLTKQFVQQSSKETGRDGHYIAYDNGVVKDTRNGLEWIAGPDKNTTWNQAKSWVEGLTIDGGGWRMPTRSELKGLYQKGVGLRNMTPLLTTNGWWVWSGKTRSSSSAWPFYFTNGYEHWSLRDVSLFPRGFAVRSQR